MTLKPLRPVLKVRELPISESRYRGHLPSINQFIGQSERPEKAKLVRYLQEGVICGVFPDAPPRDVINQERTVPFLNKGAAALLLTDGEWVWSSMLPYYVATYNLCLPDDFVESARQQGWKIDESSIDLSSVDPSTYDES